MSYGNNDAVLNVHIWKNRTVAYLTVEADPCAAEGLS
jgi:hypothetical protein